jgi:hypothetical protein
MKKVLSKIMAPLAKGWASVVAFYDSKLAKYVQKFKYALSHNFMIRREGLKLTLFGFIKLILQEEDVKHFMDIYSY